MDNVSERNPNQGQPCWKKNDRSGHNRCVGESDNEEFVSHFFSV